MTAAVGRTFRIFGIMRFYERQRTAMSIYDQGRNRTTAQLRNRTTAKEYHRYRASQFRGREAAKRYESAMEMRKLHKQTETGE